MRKDDGAIIVDKYGQARCRFGDVEYRMHGGYQEPFPLYPGEVQSGRVEKLEVVVVNTALHCVALRDFDTRKAGDEWYFPGPNTYIPRAEVQRIKLIKAHVIKNNSALRLKTKRMHKDYDGIERMAGEEYLVRKLGAFMPQVETEIVEEVKAVVLTERKALHLRALKTFTDIYKQKRKAGEEWLVTIEMAETHIKDVSEQVVGPVKITTLTDREYAVVLDPFVNGEQMLGTRQIRRGETSFFLLPGETLEGNKVQKVHVLSEDDALLVRANKAFNDTMDPARMVNPFRKATAAPSKTGSNASGGINRRPGDLWMVYGPCEYVPSVEVEIAEKRQALPLDENEGIYIRNRQTGRVRSVIGETYMLEPTEVLWEKSLPKEVEQLLLKQGFGNTYVPPGTGGRAVVAAPKITRNKTRVVTFRVAHNSALYVYDYKKKTPRIVFGPDLVMLGPDEQFTVIRLSGDKPKRPNVVSTLTLMLGPDFMTDVVTVETSDHARLNLTLSYNWHFEADRSHPKTAMEIFSVRDFTGDACKAIASRVRGAVAAETFDNFHKYSAKLIRSSVFGIKDGKVGDRLVFKTNHLVITNVDVQSVEPVDRQTRASLQKSVQLAIEITTQSQQARAKHQALKEEEMAKGQLEQQRLKNKSAAERTRKELLELEAESKGVESKGQATADAEAKSAAAKIEADASVQMANARAKAAAIEAEAKLKQAVDEQAQEIKHQTALMELEVKKAKSLADIEAEKFKLTVDAIGSDTIAAIARAGPEMQAKLLQGLGLKSMLVTDGKNPINLFQTAGGMVSSPQVAAAAAATSD